LVDLVRAEVGTGIGREREEGIPGVEVKDKTTSLFLV